MEFLVLGIIVAINFIVIKLKLDKKRWEDALLDGAVFTFIVIAFNGTYSGLIVGSIASLFVSIYFFASPPTFFSGDKGFLKTFISKAKRKDE